MPKLFLPIAAALAVAGATAGGATYLLTRDDAVEEVPPAVQATATPDPTATETPAAPMPTPTAASQTYRNEKYGYEVAVPEGYRAASFFMEQFAQKISSPGLAIDPADYAVLTTLSEEEEQEAVEKAAHEPAIGLAPWFGFASGQAMHIFPIGVIFPGVSVDDFLQDVDMAGIVRQNSDIKQVTLESGDPATRLTRREVDDNGDFTYDVVIIEADSAEGSAFILRIVKTPDYDREAFEAIFKSFTS
jgi:hypothetical protein